MPLRLPPILTRAGWLLGLPVLGLIWAGATLTAAPEIAARIAAAGEGVAAATEVGSPEPWLRVSVRGRDLVAEGEAPGPAARAAALARLAALPEPRRIVPDVGLIELVSPFAWTATRTGEGRVALTGNRPAEIGRGALRASLSTAWPEGMQVEDTAHAALGAPPDFMAGATFALAHLQGLMPGASAQLTDTIITLTGEARDVPAYDALMAALAEPPAGFTIGRTDILPARTGDFRLTVTREPGRLVLSGYVPSEAARENLGRLAAAISDAAAIDDRMRTARGLPAGIDGDALAGFLTRIVGLMQSGGASFDGARVSVTGDAVDGQAVGEIEAMLRDDRPAGIGVGAVALGVKPLSPYRVTIRREGEAVTLTGHLPDAEARERLLSTLRPRFFRERIQDRTRIAAGAPADLSAALGSAVPVLAGLAAGEVTVADRTVSLTGEGLYREAAERIAATLPAVLPAGWTARTAVQTRGAAPRRDAEACRGEAVALVGGATLRFPAGSSALQPAFYPVLDRLADLAKACPSFRVAVAGHSDPNAPASATDAAPKPEAKPPEKSEAKPPAAAKPTADKAADNKAAKPVPPKLAAAKAAPAKPAPPEPPEDLTRLRASVIVEYLHQAGAGIDQVRAAEAPSPRPGIAFLLP